MLLKQTVGSMDARYYIIIVIMVALLTMDGWQMLHREAKLLVSAV